MTKEATVANEEMAKQIEPLLEAVRRGDLDVIMTMEKVKGKTQVVVTFLKVEK